MSPKPLDEQMLALILALMTPSANVSEAEPQLTCPTEEVQLISCVCANKFLTPQECRDYRTRLQALQSREEAMALQQQYQQRLQLRTMAMEATCHQQSHAPDSPWQTLAPPPQ